MFRRSAQWHCRRASLSSWRSRSWSDLRRSSARSRGATAPQPAYASTQKIPQYLPLETVRSGTVKMPSQLARRVNLKLDGVPLQRVLMEIATQAGLGLSYGEDLVRAAPMVSVRIAGQSAADALASAVAGTQWMVLVTATGQVTVGRADVQYVGVVAGRVTDRVTTQPIENVQVTIEGTRLGQATDAEGRFAIAGVPAGPQRVAVRRIGYDPQSSVVIVTDGATQTVDFSLGAQRCVARGSRRHGDR